jgi:hypothetical protein
MRSLLWSAFSLARRSIPVEPAKFRLYYLLALPTVTVSKNSANLVAEMVFQNNSASIKQGFGFNPRLESAR